MLDQETMAYIDSTVEKALLRIPEIIGALMADKAAQMETVKKFYTEHSEFNSHKDLVGAMVQKVDAENPGASYSDLLKKATPLIHEAIRTKAKLDLSTIPTEKPTTDLGEL